MNLRFVTERLPRLLVIVSLVALIHRAGAQSPFAPPPRPEPAPSQVRGIHNPNAVPSGPIAQPYQSAPTRAVSPAPAKTQAWDTPPTTAQPLEGGQIIARIDGQVVLASDVLWQVNQLIALNREQMLRGRDSIPPDEEAAIRDMLMKRQTVGLIDTKLLYADFRRTVPAENLPKVQESLAEPFRENEIPRLIKLLDLNNRGELEAKMESFGTSLRDVQRQFIERTIAAEWLRQRTPKPREITHDQMLAYYQEHVADYDYPAQARYEELMVRFDRHRGDRDAAWRELAAMGNDVWKMVAATPGVRGPVFTEIAKQRSHGFTASDGGLHDWTTIGALKCEAINDALGELKVGQLSDGIASELGFHLIRVLQRKDAGRIPFTEAQVEIRETLQEQERSGLVEAEIKKLRQDASVWTVFHGDLNAPQLAELIDGPKRR